MEDRRANVEVGKPVDEIIAIILAEIMARFREVVEDVVRNEAKLTGSLTDRMLGTGDREESNTFASFWCNGQPKRWSCYQLRWKDC